MPTFMRDRESVSVPDRLPVLPLRDVVLFPYIVMPLLVGRQASLAAIDAAMNEGGMLLLVAQRSADTDEPAAADLHRVGVVGRVVQITRQSTGTARILVEGIARTRITRYVPAASHLRASIKEDASATAEAGPDPSGLQALARRVLSLFEEYVGLHRRIPSEVVALVQSADTLARQAYGIAAHLAVRLDTRQ